jgi:hypothetical protein
VVAGLLGQRLIVRLSVHVGRDTTLREFNSLAKKYHAWHISLTGGRSTPNLFGLSPAEALVRQRGAHSRIAVDAFGAATSDAAGERVRGPTKGSHQ